MHLQSTKDSSTWALYVLNSWTCYPLIKHHFTLINGSYLLNNLSYKIAQSNQESSHQIKLSKANTYNIFMLSMAKFSQSQ